MSQQTSSNNSEARQYLTFQLGEEEYGLDLVLAKEIIKPVKVTNVPNTEEHVLGVINLRGQIVPLLDIKRVLGLKDEPEMEKDERFIIVNMENILIGLLADRIKEVVRLKDDQIEGISENKKGYKQDYIRGVSRIDERLVIILDITKVIFTGNSLEQEVG